MNVEFKEKLIFIVDDEPDLLEALVDLIKIHFEINVQAFNSPINALEKLKEGQIPNLILSDIRMPQMDGLQFIEELKKLSVKKPVIVISAHADKKEAIQSLKLGVFGLLDKPIAYEMLIHEISRALSFEEFSLISAKLIKEKDNLIELLQKFIIKNHERISNVENMILDRKDLMFEDQEKLKNFLTNIIESNKLDGEVIQVYKNVSDLIKKQESFMGNSIA